MIKREMDFDLKIFTPLKVTNDIRVQTIGNNQVIFWLNSNHVNFPFGTSLLQIQIKMIKLS